MPKAELVPFKPRQKSRKQQAKEFCCPYHAQGEEVHAEDFCGAWLNDGSDGGRGRERRTPLCREHADVRLQLWVCPAHAPKEAN